MQAEACIDAFAQRSALIRTTFRSCKSHVMVQLGSWTFNVYTLDRSNLRNQWTLAVPCDAGRVCQGGTNAFLPLAFSALAQLLLAHRVPSRSVLWMEISRKARALTNPNHRVIVDRAVQHHHG